MSSEKNPTRDRILQATLDLLEAGGASGVRMTDIARAAGVSRQAVYLHFASRAELLIAATRHLDMRHDIQGQLTESREAPTGRARLRAWVKVWGHYIPCIYGVGKALMAMQDHDAEARAAWDGRMAAVREGCAAAVAALERDGDLTTRLSRDEAVDFLWSLQSVRMWEHLRHDCGWSQDRTVEVLQEMAERALLRQPGEDQAR